MMKKWALIDSSVKNIVPFVCILLTLTELETFTRYMIKPRAAIYNMKHY